MEPIPNFEEIDFQKHLLVLQRHWLPATGVFGVVVALASLFGFSSKPSYKAEGSVLIKTNRTPSLTGLGEGIGRLEPLAMTGNPLDTQAEIVTSVPVIEETIEELDLRDNQGERIKIEDLTKNIKVEGAKGTEVLQISYSDQNAELAAKVVNKVMQAYIKNNIEANRADAVSARKFILQQLPATEAAVKRAELALRKFKEENRIISLQEEATASVNAIATLDDQISQAQAQLADANARLQKLQIQAKVDSQQAVTFAALSQTEGIQQVLTQLQEAQSQLAVARSRFQPGHPSIIDLEERIAALNSLLKERSNQVVGNNEQIPARNLQTGQLRQKLLEDYARTEAERVGLVKQIMTLSEKRSSYKERANVLPKLEQTQRQLERKLKAAQTTYETLLTRLQEIQVAENQNIGNARVVSPALVPDKPAAQTKALMIGGGVVVGGILGIITAFSLDMIDRSIKTVKQAKELLKYPLLGIIPSVSSSGNKNYSLKGIEQPIPRVIGRDIPQFPIGEAYQMLQANLKFLSSDKEIQTIVVTSSVSKEGKSEVASNLAVAIAQVGRRVLLVDADMRHPVQHHVWNMTSGLGLSNVIVDHVPIERAIEQVMPNLYVLSSGVLPPNPLALLDSKRMAALVTSFAKQFDFVIFDTPTLSGTADAAVLSKLADGILLVVRPGVITVESAIAAKEFLTQSSQNVLGMVINGVNVNQEPNSNFYYTKAYLEHDLMLPNFVPDKVPPSKIKEER